MNRTAIEIEFIQDILFTEYNISTYEVLDMLLVCNTYSDYLKKLEETLHLYDYTGGII